MAVQVRVDRVDDAGVHLASENDVVVDVLFDGRRIWSFWTLRDTEDGLAAWPGMLRRFLNGAVRMSVVEHVTSRVAFEDEVVLGAGVGRVAVVDSEGRPLALDKYNRIGVTFDTRDPEQTRPLLDATEAILMALQEAGVAAFPAYGTLLGAVREQDFIGHDNDVDLGYVSRAKHPVDVIRESFLLQRALCDRGFEVDRYSAAAFRVDVVESDGRVRGIDVFGGYFLDGRLYLMGEIGTPFEEDWIFPLGTCTLAGRTLPAPARPEKLLEATYGPGWRVPDPAFHFETPRSTHRRLNGWFRGMRILRNEWDRRYSTIKNAMPPLEPSPLARHVLEELDPADPGLVVDLGAGRGTDGLWLARQGIPVLMLDYARGASNAVLRAAEDEGLPLEQGWVNLHEVRSVLGQGARIARRAGPVTVMANHLVDSTDLVGLGSILRLARMALGRGGRLHLDFFRPEEGATSDRGSDRIRPVPVATVVDEVTRAGAVIVQLTEYEDAAGQPARRAGARLVAEWQR